MAPLVEDCDPEFTFEEIELAAAQAKAQSDRIEHLEAAVRAIDNAPLAFKDGDYYSDLGIDWDEDAGCKQHLIKLSDGSIVEVSREGRS